MCGCKSARNGNIDVRHTNRTSIRVCMNNNHDDVRSLSNLLLWFGFLFSFLKRGRNPAIHKYLPLFLPYQEKHDHPNPLLTLTKKNPRSTHVIYTRPSHPLYLNTTSSLQPHTLSLTRSLSLSLSLTHTQSLPFPSLFRPSHPILSLLTPTHYTLSLSSQTHIYTYIHIHSNNIPFSLERSIHTPCMYIIYIYIYTFTSLPFLSRWGGRGNYLPQRKSFDCVLLFSINRKIEKT